jgi:hypothetical protein
LALRKVDMLAALMTSRTLTAKGQVGNRQGDRMFFVIISPKKVAQNIAQSVVNFVHL